jgi:hypothetical protein
MSGTTNNNYWNKNGENLNNYKYKSGNIKQNIRSMIKTFSGSIITILTVILLKQGDSKSERFNGKDCSHIISNFRNRNSRDVHNATAFTKQN